MYQLQSSTSVSFEQSVLEDLEQMCTFVANVVALQPMDIVEASENLKSYATTNLCPRP